MNKETPSFEEAWREGEDAPTPSQVTAEKKRSAADNARAEEADAFSAGWKELKDE